LLPRALDDNVSMIGLMPIMRSFGTGADVMKRVAAPTWWAG
jgi:Cu/Ag efflux pump CusA